jgi:hypothetical protein
MASARLSWPRPRALLRGIAMVAAALCGFLLVYSYFVPTGICCDDNGMETIWFGAGAIVIEHPIGPLPWRGYTESAIPLWIPTVACVALAVLLAVPDWRNRFRPGPGQCPKCRYNLAGLPPNSPCPECGRARS